MARNSPADQAPDNARGVLWMLVSVVFASAMSLAVRELSVTLDSRMIVALRAGAITLALVSLVSVMPAFRTRLRITRPRLHIVRGLFVAVSTHLGFYTLAHLPIATATVLFFTAPIFATVLATIWHGERVGHRRAAAVAAGFIGAVVILRPGFAGFHPAMLTALGSSALFALALTTSRDLSRADGPVATFASSAVITAILSLPLAAPVAVMPMGMVVGVLILVLAISSAARSIADIEAYAHAEAAILAPVAYLRLVVLGIAGYLLWGEVPDRPTIAGAAIIVGATVYIARREAKLRRAA